MSDNRLDFWEIWKEENAPVADPKNSKPLADLNREQWQRFTLGLKEYGQPLRLLRGKVNPKVINTAYFKAVSLAGVFCLVLTALSTAP